MVLYHLTNALRIGGQTYPCPMSTSLTKPFVHNAQALQEKSQMVNRLIKIVMQDNALK